MTTHHLLRAFLGLLSLLAALLAPRPAVGQTAPTPVIVVDIDPTATEIDAGALRKAIAQELGMDAVAPDDPRAASARGSLTVTVARDAKKLVVSYRARGTPITRDVPLPGDAAATSRAAVLLAGNLARDEASDLAEELRKRAHPHPPPPISTSWDEPTPEDGTRLDAALKAFAERDRSSRRVIGWTGLSLIEVATGASIYAAVRNRETSFAFIVPAFAFGWSVNFGFQAFAPSPLEQLLEVRRKGANVEATEQEWARQARSERGTRRVYGVLSLITGGLLCSFGTFLLVRANDAGVDNTGVQWSAAIVLALGGAIAMNGAYDLAHEGPFESSLHAYRLGTQRAPKLDAGYLGRFRVSMVPGGAVAGFGGTF